MRIAKGYPGNNDNPVEIYISPSSTNKRESEVWVRWFEDSDSKLSWAAKEILSYASLYELLDLQEEIQDAIKRITGTKEVK